MLFRFLARSIARRIYSSRSCFSKRRKSASSVSSVASEAAMAFASRSLPRWVSSMICARRSLAGFAHDQPVALHAGQRIGKRRLLHVDSIQQLPLRQSLLMPQFDEDGELSRENPSAAALFWSAMVNSLAILRRDRSPICPGKPIHQSVWHLVGAIARFR